MHEPAQNDPDRHAAEPSRGRSTPFQRIARSATAASGSGWAALAVVAAGACWTLVGWSAGFPRWWELVATAGVPFVTLLMVVLLQHTQNHHAQATHLKLDELIRSSNEASDRMMTVEKASPEDLDRIHESFERHASTPGDGRRTEPTSRSA
jgi:low affinity Fe/Cu permease